MRDRMKATMPARDAACHTFDPANGANDDRPLSVIVFSLVGAEVREHDVDPLSLQASAKG
jgi:hypothetical protein